MPNALFHPATARWFEDRFPTATGVQLQAWPAIQRGHHTLIAAPTGSGKTLAAFLAAIDGLVREGLERPLEDETRILYVSPLKALSNDIHKNLELPLNGIRDALLESGLPDVPIRAQVRSGDTSQAEREAMKRTPPHVLVTTPESLYLLLTSQSGREMLSTVRSVIVDEIHALAGNKRGAHLTLSLERLAALTPAPPVRIGLSATQKPIDTMARYLVGERDEPYTIVDTGHSRERDLGLEVPDSPLEAVMANEVWGEVYARLEQLVLEHRTTLIFVNTRRLAERAAAALAERLGEEAVTSHHGSLAKEHRLDAETRLKQGRLRALVATASLELGIDIGDVDLVCQLGSTRNIATFLQRVGRSGHAVGALPKGRLFPLTRNDLFECTAMLQAIRQGQLDHIPIPEHPLDVLAQQIVAEVAGQEWEEEKLYQIYRRAWPYRGLTREQFTSVVKMLSEGFHTRRGRRGAYIHRDAVHGRLRPRNNARLTALLNGGAIPDQFDYDVILQPEGYFIGTLNEDFAFESLPGDIFQLGNTSYRMLKIEQGRVFVEDAQGQPPNLPFWLGEAPGRSDELSSAVSQLRETLDALLEQGQQAALDYLQKEIGLNQAAAFQLVQYLAAGKAALTVLPSQQHIVFERFFDETGDMHFVIHAPYGSRINRAWGLALRKRFCRRFNFELQAAANEDNLILSLGPTHSFPLEEPASYLNPKTAEQILVQALLAAPMFPTRWRWVANTALAVPRNRGGKKVPAPFQRNDAEDLIALVFPDQLACFENIDGDREVPEHPLVDQTLWDCLHELMDIDGLLELLKGLESGAIRVITRELATPSPMALEILNAQPYAFLDDAPAEERRTLAVQQRRYMDPQSAADIGRLDPSAIQRVCAQAWPEAHTPDEMHDALNLLGFMTEVEGEHGPLSELHERLGHESNGWGWPGLMETLQRDRRTTVLTTPDGRRLWANAERLHQLLALFPEAVRSPEIDAMEAIPPREEALLELVRSRLEGLGPVTVAELASPLGMPPSEVQMALLGLQQEGFAIQGRFRSKNEEWCERGLLARIHRDTLKQLRSEVEAVSPADFMRFLFQWHGLDQPAEGEEALLRSLGQLEGLNLPAASWERDILPVRLSPYLRHDLDRLCASGKVVWLRLQLPATGDKRRKGGAIRTTPVALMPRPHLAYWRVDSPLPQVDDLPLSAAARKVYDILREWGASFFDELLHEAHLLRSQLEEALGELVAWGLVSTDSFQGLRSLTTPQQVQRRRVSRKLHGQELAAAGRWSLLRPVAVLEEGDRFAHVEHIARVLLRRYGVVFRKLLDREQGLPPWRELLYIYRRMEARGEIRGGRFVNGFSGEQFALPEAVGGLRVVHRRPGSGEMLAISASDPLNLTGLITTGKRIPAQHKHRILYRDGVPVAVSADGRIDFFAETTVEEQWQGRNLLLRKQHPGYREQPRHPV